MTEWIASSTVLIAAVLLVRQLFKDRISKRLQYALWGLVLLRLLIPGSLARSAVSVANLVSDLSAPPAVQEQLSTPSRSYESALEDVLTEHKFAVDVFYNLPETRQAEIRQEYQQEVQQKLEESTPAYHLPLIAESIWLWGAAIMGLCLLVANLRLALRLRRSRKKLDSPQSLLPVYTSGAVQTPCLFGLFHPAIYLPEGIAVSGKPLDFILAHELTHYRHLDHIWAITRCICLALHWYNPLVWIAVKVSRTDSELACDEGALAKLGEESRESYGHTLIEMSCAKPSVQDYLLTATTMTGDKKSLYQRIQSIAKKPRFILAAVISLAVVALVIVGCTFTGATGDPTLETTQPTESTAMAETTVPTTTAPPPATLPPETTVPTETQPPTFPMGNTGAATGGALCSLPLNMSPYCDAYPLGENILLCQPQEGVYQIRSLQDGSVLAKATDTNFANTVTVTDDQIIYYSLSSNKIIFRDMSLEIVKTLDFSLNDSVSEMLFSNDGNKAYYCTDVHTVVELDIDTFKERVIPVNGPQIWALSGLYFDDSILRFWGKEDGNDYYGFINLDTGAYLGKDTAMTRFQDWDNNYYLCRAYQGTAEHLVVLDGSHRYMIPKDHGMDSYNSWLLPPLNSFFTLSLEYESPVVVLDLYDLNTKQRTSSLTVDLGGEYGSSAEVFVDTSGEYIWLCLKVGGYRSGYQMVLYRWDFRANAIEDTTVYGYGG